jgi:hypothetical protein
MTTKFVPHTAMMATASSRCAAGRGVREEIKART